MSKTNEQQPTCLKCEEAKTAAQNDYEDQLMAAAESLCARMEKIYLEHERGGHSLCYKRGTVLEGVMVKSILEPFRDLLRLIFAALCVIGTVIGWVVAHVKG